MQAYELIAKVKEATGIESDYAAAKAIGISRAALSEMKAGRTTYVSEETAMRAAELTGLDAESVVLDQLIQRVKSPALREAIKQRVQRVCILCSIAFKEVWHRKPALFAA